MKTKILFIILLFITGNGFSQCLEINCPGDTVFQAPNDGCESVFNYGTPVGIDNCVVTTDTFNFTGSEQTFIVPSGIDTLFVELYGAQGNSNQGGIAGGFGGYAEGKIPVNSGDQIYIYVGDGGNTDQNGGFNGGGNAGSSPTLAALAGGGGGASDIRIGGNTLTDRIIVAGGGAGAGGNRVSGGSRGTGGGGGGGYYGGGGGAGWPNNGTMALGGTQSSGGAGGTSSWDPNFNGYPGILGVGGDGGIQITTNQVGSANAIPGADGGGLVGNVGTYAGGWVGGSGAGGSSYIASVIDGVTQSGIQSGPGKVIIKWNGQPATTAMVSGLSSGDIFPSGTTTTTYEVNDGGGNTETCSFDVTVLPNIDTSVAVSGATLEAQNSNATYQWIDCTTNNAINNETNQVYEPQSNGTYAVIIDQNGCIDTSSCYQISTVGLEGISSDYSFNIFPNPTKSKLSITHNKSDLTGTILVYTADGKSVLKKAFENTSTIDLSIPGKSGVYFVQIIGKDFHYTARVIKQ